MSDWLSNDHQIGVVSTFSELVNTPFQGKRNALCWQRHLVGNFKEIAERLPAPMLYGMCLWMNFLLLIYRKKGPWLEMRSFVIWPY